MVVWELPFQHPVKRDAIDSELASRRLDAWEERHSSWLFRPAFGNVWCQHDESELTKVRLHRKKKVKVNLQFANRLSEMLKERGIKPAEFAREIKISHVAVGNWLRGAVPKSDKLQKITDFLNVSTDELLHGKAWVDLRADLKEDDRVATMVAESGDPQRIGNLIFNLRGEDRGRQLMNIRVAKQLRDLADQLDPPPQEIEHVAPSAKTQSQSQSQTQVSYSAKRR